MLSRRELCVAAGGAAAVLLPARPAGAQIPASGPLVTLLTPARLFDSRVDPLHAKKFAALVQNNPGQISPFLLYMDFDSGHGTGKTTQQRVVDRDYELRFVMNALGMNGGATTAAK